MRYLIIFILIVFSLFLYGETQKNQNDTNQETNTKEKKENIKKIVDKASVDLKKGKEIKKDVAVTEVKKETDQKSTEIKEKVKDEKRYKYTLTPADCNPIKNSKSVKVFEVTSFEYVFKNNRRFWISAGSIEGIEKGMEITVCKNTDSFRFYPIAKAEIAEVWDDKSIATLNDAQTNIDETLPENPYYLAKGDMIVFTETSKLIYDPAWFKKKDKKKPKKKIPPPEYRKEFFPEFREELLKGKQEKKTEKPAEKSENIKEEKKDVI